MLPLLFMLGWYTFVWKLTCATVKQLRPVKRLRHDCLAAAVQCVSLSLWRCRRFHLGGLERVICRHNSHVKPGTT